MVKLYLGSAPSTGVRGVLANRSLSKSYARRLTGLRLGITHALASITYQKERESLCPVLQHNNHHPNFSFKQSTLINVQKLLKLRLILKFSPQSARATTRLPR